jgi:glutathione S-transferase
MRAKLVGVIGSHPVLSAELMLRYKGIDFTRLDLPNMTHKLMLPLLRYRGSTVPVLTIDGHRVSGTMKIARALEAIKPDPPLFPADPAQRVQVEDAERWGDEILQNGVRRILWNAIKRDRAPLRSYLDGARIGVPHGMAVATAAPIIAAELRINDVTDDAVEADMAAFPGWLDRIDGWIEGGVLGGEPPNAADFQIAAALGLAMTLDDLRPAIEARPAGQLANRLVPGFPGKVPPVLPAEWLQPLTALG